MSGTPASFTSSPTPTDASSSLLEDNTSIDTEATGGAQYYNYFFLLLAVGFLILFLLLFYFQRRRKAKNARLQQHGRAALVQDVSRFSPAAALWSRRTAEEPSRRLNRMRSACHDSILEAGLDERGEAPPPYNTAAADKAPPMSRRETTQPARVARLAVPRVPVGEGLMCRPPPGYRETDGAEEGMGRPARPGAVVVVAERLSGADLEAQPRHDVHRSRIQPRSAGRWSSMRRLMGSTEGSV